MIVMVKKTLEARFWLLPGGALSGFDGEPVEAGGKLLRVLYGGECLATVWFRADVTQTRTAS